MSWISSWIYGVDLDEQQATGDAADAKLKELNKSYAPGGDTYNRIADQRGEYAAIQSNLIVQDHEETDKTGDVTSQVEDSFNQGIKDSYPVQAVNGTVSLSNGILSYAAKTIFKIVPWYIWLVAVLAIGLYIFINVKSFIPRKG